MYVHHIAKSLAQSRCSVNDNLLQWSNNPWLVVRSWPELKVAQPLSCLWLYTPQGLHRGKEWGTLKAGLEKHQAGVLTTVHPLDLQQGYIPLWWSQNGSLPCDSPVPSPGPWPPVALLSWDGWQSAQAGSLLWGCKWWHYLQVHLHQLLTPAVEAGDGCEWRGKRDHKGNLGP